MATRATIKIDGVDYAKAYKHWDGYPEATLPFLEAFNKGFAENRGDDPEYKFAQLLRRSISWAEQYELGTDHYTGWGVCPFNSDMGEDYEYTLKADGTVKVKQI